MLCKCAHLPTTISSSFMHRTWGTISNTRIWSTESAFQKMPPRTKTYFLDTSDLTQMCRFSSSLLPTVHLWMSYGTLFCSKTHLSYSATEEVQRHPVTFYRGRTSRKYLANGCKSAGLKTKLGQNYHRNMPLLEIWKQAKKSNQLLTVDYSCDVSVRIIWENLQALSCQHKYRDFSLPSPFLRRCFIYLNRWIEHYREKKTVGK